VHEIFTALNSRAKALVISPEETSDLPKEIFNS